MILNPDSPESGSHGVLSMHTSGSLLQTHWFLHKVIKTRASVLPSLFSCFLKPKRKTKWGSTVDGSILQYID